MAVWERQTQKLCYEGPSFSSSLLDAIYRSIDETRVANDHQETEGFALHRRKNAAQVEEDIESLRRAIMMEKCSSSKTPRHVPSSSASSVRHLPKLKQAQPIKILQLETGLEPEGRLTRTKSKAQKIYGELKKVKEPISPGGKITNFLNSIFSPRNSKTNQALDEWSPMRKSRSLKDTAKASRSCLSKNVSCGGSKSKRSVRFCPVSVIVDERCQSSGDKSIYDDEFTFGSQFVNKNIDSLQVYEGENTRKQEFRDYLDDMSCASSDLFELENIGSGAYEEELPVYGTTSLEM